MTKIELGNMDAKIKGAIHGVFAQFFDEIEKATGGEIQVEDLTINTYAVDVSVTMKPREDEERFGGTPQEKFTRGIEAGRYRHGTSKP